MNKRIKEIIVRYDDKQSFIYGNTLGEVVGELVRCAECVYCNIQNTKYLYAICERHGIEFKPFEDDTRTHFCAWGIKADRKTEPTGYNLSPVDKDINVRSKGEPQTDGYISGEDFMKIFDEPQTDCQWK